MCYLRNSYFFNIGLVAVNFGRGDNNMKLKEKITGLLAAAMVLSANIAAAPVYAETSRNPHAEIILEPKRTAAGIDYAVYIEHASSLSTLMLAVDFSAAKKGIMSLADNACFDISHSKWSSGNQTSLKAYLGRTGQKTGFSSDEKIKVAQISIPIDISEVGEVTATVSGAICAGVVQTDGDAVKGTVTVPEQPVSHVIKECSVLSFDKNKVNILSSKNRSADVIYALYDSQGRLVNTYEENIGLKQGENEISPDGIDFGQAETISVMIWDGIGSMRPLANKTTINNRNGD